MTANELRDRIDTWLSLTNQRAIPPTTNPVAAALKAQTEAQWDGGMLKNAADLELVPELVATIAEPALVEAIEMAKRKDRNSLPAIEKRLRQVQAYMAKNGM